MSLNDEDSIVLNGDEKMNFEILREPNPEPALPSGEEAETGAETVAESTKQEQVYPYDQVCHTLREHENIIV